MAFRAGYGCLPKTSHAGGVAAPSLYPVDRLTLNQKQTCLDVTLGD
ncbi:hypothetical protein GS597_06100 [Synechococcales cyanobacterium C]|uniref:Uncharacterized protein n=1 Tax=Petrachloros mirabilis ULC683 TaxID=2781853 RepID=A0A8K2A6I4_9CYAN|nr:hypothetical protein [Petrachloros mirabilis]NCJ06094.1 hypothetical protein [Petrachloros mirabilis ULC683]